MMSLIKAPFAFFPAWPAIALTLLSFSPSSASAAPASAPPRPPAREDEVRFEIARQWVEKGEYDKAVQELRLYLNDHPDAAEVYARIGSLRLRQGKTQLASENFKIALAKNPAVVEARKGLAMAYEKLGEKEKALEEWRRLRDAPAGPGGPDAETRRLASEKVKSGTAGAAAEGNPKATPGSAPQKGPGDAGPASESSSGAPKEAVRPAANAESAYSPALDSASQGGPPPGAAKGIYAQKEFQDALRHYREKKIDSALVDLRKTLSKTPGHPGAYYLGGVIRYERGDLAKAAFNFKRSFGYPDRGFNASFYLGRIYQRQERNSEAIPAFEKYLKETKSEAGRRQAEKYLAQLRGAEPKADTGAAETPVSKPEGIPKPVAGEGHPAASAAKAAETERSQDGAPQAGGSRSGGLAMGGADGGIPFLAADSASASGRKILEAAQAARDEKFEKSANALKDVMRTYGGSPNADAAALDLAGVYVRLGLWDNARDRIEDYMSRAKDGGRYLDLANYLMGLVHLGKRDGDKAEAALLQVKPGGPEAPSREEIDFRLAQSGELLQDNKKWAAYLERAQATAVDKHRKAALWQQLGALHSKFGSTEKALEFFRKSQEDCRDSALEAICTESQLRMADLEYQRKGWKASLALYRQFATRHPDHKEAPWSHYQMANIYRATNNFESALNEYKWVIDNYPDSYWAAQAKWKREDTIWRKEYEEVLD